MFQAGRTVTTVENANHLANEFGKSLLRHHLQKEGKDDLLAFLPEVKITMPGAIIDAIGQHLAMYPLIDDLDCTLFINHTKEDFLTSDHPIALCNNLPSRSPFGANMGFASRGLIILFPLSPRALVFLSDREVYKVAKDGRGVALITKRREIVELNLLQCFNAHENLYFAALARTQETREAFRKRKDAFRRARLALTETPMRTETGRSGILLRLPHEIRRLTLPKAVEQRQAVRKGNYVLGDARVRDPARTAVVKAELDRLQTLREEATKKAKATGTDRRMSS